MVGDVALNSLLRGETVSPRREKRTRGRNPRTTTARGRPPGRNGGNRPSTTEIDRRRPILVLPPGSGRSAYRLAVGPVCTGRYGSYRSVRKTLYAHDIPVMN
ncbi:hypothetical protein GW17_00012538 [Ensete ventricosum]|nr:hypothetical protein GW17_00012538 [Ensete ventricosum]